MSRITLSDLIKRGIHNPPDGTRTLALGGVVAGSSAAMYNNYNKALSKTSAVDTSELTQEESTSGHGWRRCRCCYSARRQR